MIVLIDNAGDDAKHELPRNGSAPWVTKVIQGGVKAGASAWAEALAKPTVFAHGRRPYRHDGQLVNERSTALDLPRRRGLSEGHAAQEHARGAARPSRARRAGSDAAAKTGPAVIAQLPQDPARLARRLPHARCRRHRHLRRQGAQPQGARDELRARRQPHQPHRPHDRRHRRHGVRDGAHRGRGAAAGSQPHQALPAALQRAAARRQVVPLHPDRARAHRRRRSSSIAARATARATTSGRSPRPAPSTAPSTCWSARSCCAPARTPCSRAARGPACCIRSSAARRPAPARSASRTTARWSRRRRASCAARARTCARCTSA